MQKCEICNNFFEENPRGRPRQFCSNTCVVRASAIRNVPLEAILRLRPDIRKLVNTHGPA
jgi:hypothetical protein